VPYSVVVKKNATIPDTLQLINLAVNIQSRSPFVKELTASLNPTGDKKEFCKRLFDWVCKNIEYQLDTPGDEEVWSPRLTAERKIGDCKKMSTLIASVLKCAGIEPILKHVRYKDSPNTHIYVIVPYPDIKSYLVLDPVNNKKWNTEVEHVKTGSTLNFLNGKKMDLHLVGRPNTTIVKHKFRAHAPKGFIPQVNKCVCGIDDDISGILGLSNQDSTSVSGKDEVLANALVGDFGITGLDEEVVMEGIGRRRKKSAGEKRAAKEKRKERRKKLFHVFKAVNLAPSRAAFLLLVHTNIFKLANRMAKAWIHNPDGLKKMWKQFGGNPNKLKEAIKKGVRRKNKALAEQVKGIGSMSSAPSVSDLERMEVSGMGYVEGIGSAAAVAAAIAAATPIVIAVIKIIGKSKDDQDTKGDSSEVEEAANESAQRVQDTYGGEESTEGIGYMHEEDFIVSGDDYDYVDGIGRKRKKNKEARKEEKRRKKEEKKARRKSKKKKDGESEEQAEQGAEQEIQEEETQKRKVRISNDDIKTLSTLAEYGTRKILKGQVTKSAMNKITSDLDEGTENTPIQTIKDTITETAETLAPKPSGAAAGSTFGLIEINSIPTLLHWFKGSMVLSIGGSLNFPLLIITNTIIIGSFLYLTRKHFNKFLTFKK